MISILRGMRPALPILLGAACMLTLAMGLRQSLGIFMQPMTRGVGVTIADFTLAVAIQNLVWGVLQPFAGAWTARHGFRGMMLAGAVLYAGGMAALATAQGSIGVLLGAGLAVGAAMACLGSAVALAVASRAVDPSIRSTVLGIVSAIGSLGALIAAPLGQSLSTHGGWRWGVGSFFLLALLLVPAAWIAGRVDRLPLPAAQAGDGQDARSALRAALRSPPFVVLTAAFFVCGMQLVFLTTHLPSYLDLCGMDPMLAAQALGVIGAFNVAGSLFFGWAGGRWNKLFLLGAIYLVRSVALAVFFASPPTPATTLAFAAVMGFLWLGVAPLVAGWIADNFGLRWQAMLSGVAFVSHQLGSFVGAYAPGLLLAAAGSYGLAWQAGVVVGIAAGLVQIASALARPIALAPGR